jgi:hypothetical protein
MTRIQIPAKADIYGTDGNSCHQLTSFLIATVLLTGLALLSLFRVRPQLLCEHARFARLSG